jgi:hypothetical protein
MSNQANATSQDKSLKGTTNRFRLIPPRLPSQPQIPFAKSSNLFSLCTTFSHFSRVTI